KSASVHLRFYQTVRSDTIYSNYKFNVIFNIPPNEPTMEQKVVTQFLANFVLFKIIPDLVFMYTIWILVSIIPIFVYNNYKKAYSMNLITFFFPNFFLYIFLSRYSIAYFNSYFPFHLVQTILLGIVIAGFSIGISIGLNKFLKYIKKDQIEIIDSIAKEGQITCPNCGIKFESIPKYCYKCNRILIGPDEND
ncbi:MAG: hypothetical protein ACFFEY_03470, partial [Candidatus Thorarchaeota archaeon]